MDWVIRMNKSIEMIEANLAGKVSRRDLAAVAYCSEYQYHRTFTLATGMTLGEYIRKRRLSKAAAEIQAGSKVMDVALKYGYESPESFARAFKALHGVAPSAARKAGVVLKACPKISFQIILKGEKALDYRIEKREAFRIYGIEGIFTMEGGQNFVDIPKFWDDAWESGNADKLLSTGHADWDTGAYALNAMCEPRYVGEGKFAYMLFVLEGENSNMDGYSVIDVPASTWAVFKSDIYDSNDSSSVKVIQDHIKRVYNEWMPSTEYTVLPGYDMELYYGTPDYKDTYMEVWLRVS